MSKLKEKKKMMEQEAKKGFDFTYVFIGIALVLVLGFLYLIFFVPQNGGPISGDIASDDPFKGPGSAKVTLVEFSDFQCPACGAAYPTLKTLSGEYSDRVKFVYRDFPLTQIHPYAQKAAEAANCALEQEKFWEYHDMLFENQESLQVAQLKQYAVSLGLDAEQFNSCLDSAKYANEVASDQSDGIRFGVNGTPTFFINGTKYSNMSYAQFKGIIDAELAK